MFILPLPAVALAALIGVGSVCLFPVLPNINKVYLIFSLALLLLGCQRNFFVSYICAIAIFFSFMAYEVNCYSKKQLSLELEGQKITVVGTIASIVINSTNTQQTFLFKVNKVDAVTSNWHLPALLKITWNNSTAPKLWPGDTWRLKIKVNKVRNYANPGSYDMQRYYWSQRISGRGYILANSNTELLQRNQFAYPLHSLRQQLKIMLDTILDDDKFTMLIQALTIGLKANLSTTDALVLQDTGTMHLMSVSGLHIGMLSAFCFMSIKLIYYLMPRLMGRFSRVWLGAILALLLSIFYAGLAGFAVATQRAIIMLAAFLSGIVFKRQTSSTHNYSLALLCVLLIDPFVVLGMGFWFSFIAVAGLLFIRRQQKINTKIQKFWRWYRPQIVLTLVLLPLTVLFFSKNSLVAPLANAIAIPWVSGLILPICLCAVFLLPIWPSFSSLLLKMALKSFTGLWFILSKLATLPVYTWCPPTSNLLLIIMLALLGVVWLYLPRGLPSKYWGILNLLAMFFVPVKTIPYGQASFTVLDVGQGLASVIQTQTHVLVYDTGAKLRNGFDLGLNIVVPYLQTKGIKKIDLLMISHADNDHVGGALGILSKINTNNILASDLTVLPGFKSSLCKSGQEWQWDGVYFKVLHPAIEDYRGSTKRNNYSCVLMVQAGTRKVILTGDIEKQGEKQIIARYGADLQADVMLVPHHGSKTSSSDEFLQTIQPQYAVIPVGYKNQYGHPKAEVMQRYSAMGIKVLRTDLDGAVNFQLSENLKVDCYRHNIKYFWLR